ncbi:MAG TPA: YchJ family metal-binding protein [Burkholderiaceae bacterium]|nr:YchJ family metal-binding protein [Burkholderiaceae bacterium]
MTRTSKPAPCPCGGNNYARCCGRFIDGGEIPQTAEQLMRSRYTAYTLHNEDYLKATWHASTRPLEAVAQDEEVKWIGLDVRRYVPDDDTATVEFVARYKVGGRAHRLHEVSRFMREDGRWYYVDGSFPTTR